MSLSEDIEKYAHNIVKALNDAPHLSKYIYKQINDDFKPAIANAIITRVKEIIKEG